MGGLNGSSRFYPAQHGQQFRGINLVQRPTTDPRKNILLQANPCACMVTFADLEGMDGGKPFTGDSLEGTLGWQAGFIQGHGLRRDLLCRLLNLPHFAGVGPSFHQSTCLVAPDTGLSQ